MWARKCPGGSNPSPSASSKNRLISGRRERKSPTASGTEHAVRRGLCLPGVSSAAGLGEGHEPLSPGDGDAGNASGILERVGRVTVVSMDVLHRYGSGNALY